MSELERKLVSAALGCPTFNEVPAQGVAALPQFAARQRPAG